MLYPVSFDCAVAVASKGDRLLAWAQRFGCDCRVTLYDASDVDTPFYVLVSERCSGSSGLSRSNLIEVSGYDDADEARAAYQTVAFCYGDNAITKGGL